jgi:hypothetical protein
MEKENVKVWVARNGGQDGSNNGALWLYYLNPPKWSEKYWKFFGDYNAPLDEDNYPEIKNGECYSAEIVLMEKISD